MVSFPLAPASAARHLLLARLRVLGGKGSGNFGHAGRPGERGGSGTGDGSVPKGIIATPENKAIKWEKQGKYYVNAEPLTLYHGTSESSAAKIDAEGLRYGNLALTPHYAADIARIRREGEAPVVFEVQAPPHSIYPVFHGPKGVQTDALALAKPISTVTRLDPSKWRTLGGPGSGNFGHAGRPGERGGSLLSEPKATDFSRPVLGIISSSGEVKTRNSNDKFNTHEQLFGEKRPPQHSFRVVGSEVHWDEEPSADEAFRVEDHVAAHGAHVTAHAVLASYIGGKRYFTPGELSPIKNPRHLASALPLHAAADAQVPKLEVLVRYAFAMGRKALPDADAAIKATEKALKALLPAALEKVVTAGIKATPEIRAAGGPGSGNFGHAGRPGEIGGSVSAVSITENSTSVTFKSKHGNIEAGRQGHTLKIRESFVNTESRGKGEGVKLYEAVLNYAEANNLTVQSSAAVSVSAERVWQSLKRKGYAVERAVDIELDESLGKFYAVKAHTFQGVGALNIRSGEPVWKFTPKAVRTLATKAKLPTRKQAASNWADEHAADLIKGISKTTRERVNAAVSEYSDRPLQLLGALKKALGDEDRARTIARTESMRAVHKGQQIVWQEAQDEGLLSEKTKRVWIVTPDDKLCPICEPLDGKTAALDDAYDAGSEYLDGPPAHPNCRCTEGLA